MSNPQPIDAREVTSVEVLATSDGPHDPDAFLKKAVVGSTWYADIRTASVNAVVAARAPLGSVDERICTCLRLKLDRPVPVEPGLRFRILDPDSTLQAACLVRPWNDPPPPRSVPPENPPK